MFKYFISLEWKSFIRSASFKTNLFLKIMMVFGALWMIASFSILGFGAYYMIEDGLKLEPFQVVNQVAIYYMVFDLAFRYFLQKMPVMNIKPLMYLPIKRKAIVNFAMGKTMISFFNVLHAFFFIPFSIVLIIEGFPPLQVIAWYIAILGWIYCNNFINIFINNKDVVFYGVVAFVIVMIGLQYYGVFDLTYYTAPIFKAFYAIPYLALIPIVLAVVFYKMAFSYFKKNLYLDAGLSVKHDIAETEDYSWLDRFGSLSTFLKNDIRLLRRNKRSKMTLIMSVVFLFYGLLFFTGSVEAYDGPFWKIFAGIFVSGGFLFTFGQFVPSWDSAYYPLMMSQNIRYKEYLASKWYLMVFATIISTVVSAFYLYWGWQAYAAVVVGAIYNIGVNSHLVLWGGAYIKSPIDLTTSKKAFGDKQAFNAKTMLLTIPKLLLPMAIYAAGHFTLGEAFGFALVALSGLVGFLFKNKVFDIIEKVYKSEKYKTLAAYKQNN
ncbi:hypothetical protein LX77_01935 [Gelidibacter algens]|uniref:ABC-2 type transport system permease protein n=1 Tax=Gelidibacter algens TaxID=49280 RepID=A0A1A7QVS4_9FLAO|nr:DUF5687 family protein [Gelidibacter algens]OBX22622.1 hypothetical protein A9996_16775 [Gelidibacter algens]RAJ24383.1 hypothetical protein LX77_01935 [Gelidibacter algens]